MDFVSLRAYAKINLALDVLGKREDGYHEVRMIMQTIGLYDRLSINMRNKPGIQISTNVSFLPTNENNLVHAAAKLFMEHCGIESGLYIKLEKRIPVAAGLAGGSSDAAATLIGLNKLFDTGLSLEELQELGVKLGADVPYCLLGGTALSEGIGEKLTALGDAPKAYCLIVKPPLNVSTKTVYKKLVLDDSIVHPDIDSMLDAISRKNLRDMCGCMGNVLESVTAAEHPQIEEIKSELRARGAVGAMMSGSGPTVFGLFDNKQLASSAFYYFKVGKYGRQTFLTELERP